MKIKKEWARVFFMQLVCAAIFIAMQGISYPTISYVVDNLQIVWNAMV